MKMHNGSYASAPAHHPDFVDSRRSSSSVNPDSLLGAFWIVVASLSAIYLYALLDTDALDVAWAFAISGAAMLPAYFWCTGRAHGMPILPLFALSHIWAFAFPLVSKHPQVALYDSDQRSIASLTVILFLLIATAVWYRFVNQLRVRRETWLELSSESGDRLFLGILAAASLFTVSIYRNWFGLPVDIMSSLRGIILGLGALGIFVLACRWGNGTLAKSRIKWFVLFLGAYMLVNATSTLLVGSMTSFLLAVIGYSVGRRKVPWGIFGIGIALFVFLHVGKGEVRDRYLYGDDGGTGRIAALSEYPAFFSEWIHDSWNNWTDDSREGAAASLLQRSSLLHILLMVEQDSPNPVPFMNGATYADILPQLIPRIFDPDKVSAHEGTVLLNLHYGLQASREDAAVTSIGWGLLSESFANFGYSGVAGLAIILGLAFGGVSRWSMNAPVLSFRFLCALLVLAQCFNTEISTGAFLASMYQSFLALLGVRFTLMRPVWTQELRG